MKRPLLIVAVILFLGIFMMNLRADTRELLLYDRPAFATRLENSQSGFYVGELRGTVEWIFKKNGKQVLKVDGGNDYGKVYCYLDSEELLTPDYLGCQIKLDGSFFLFREGENPGEFDSRTYYENMGIYLGYTISDMAVLKSPVFVPKRPFYAIYREAMVRCSSFSDEADMAFYETLLATSSGEEEDLKDLLRTAYLSQLLSSSGLLISAFGMILFRILKRLVKSDFIRAIIPVIVMALYSFIIGSPIAFLRAILIFGIRLFAPVFHRSFDLLSAAGLSMILLMLERPTYALLPAVYFYFAVLLSVGICYPLVKRLFRLRTGLFLYGVLSFSLLSAFLPLQVSSSYGINLYQPLLSLVLLPLKSMAILSMLIGLLVSFFTNSIEVLKVFFGISHYLRLFIEQITEAVKALPFSSICTGKPSFFRCIVFYILYAGLPVVSKVFLELRKRKKESKEVIVGRKHKFIVLGFLVVLFLFGILFLRADARSETEVRYVQLSVGQGDSELIMAKDFTMVVDNGSSSVENTGEILENALKYYGITEVDVFILTHADDDHTNGILEFLADETMTIGEVWISGAENEVPSYYERLKTLPSETVVRKVHRGDIYEKGEVKITVINPEKNTSDFGNDASVVCIFEKGAFSALLLGDISSETERELPLPNTSFSVFKVSHHGSKYSNSAVLLQRISAEYALCSAGKNNSYGHPHQDAVRRIEGAGMTFLCTKDYGAIELFYRNGKLKKRKEWAF